jgi:hypothetical protein
MSRMGSIDEAGTVFVGPCRLLSVTLTSAAEAGSMTVQDGTGDVFLTLGSVTADTVVWRPRDKDGIPITTSINVAAITGTASVEYA